MSEAPPGPLFATRSHHASRFDPSARPRAPCGASPRPTVPRYQPGVLHTTARGGVPAPASRPPFHGLSPRPCRYAPDPGEGHRRPPPHEAVIVPGEADPTVESRHVIGPVGIIGLIRPQCIQR